MMVWWWNSCFVLNIILTWPKDRMTPVANWYIHLLFCYLPNIISPIFCFFYSFKCAPFPLFLSLPLSLSLSTKAKYVSPPIYNKLSFPSNWISSLAAFVGWATHFSLILFLFYPKMMYCITHISPFPDRFFPL